MGRHDVAPYSISIKREHARMKPVGSWILAFWTGRFAWGVLSP